MQDGSAGAAGGWDLAVRRAPQGPKGRMAREDTRDEERVSGRDGESRDLQEGRDEQRKNMEVADRVVEGEKNTR